MDDVCEREVLDRREGCRLQCRGGLVERLLHVPLAVVHVEAQQPHGLLELTSRVHEEAAL